MSRKLIYSFLLLPAFLACGCEGGPNAVGGAMAGTAIGAGTGALIGRGPGALIGAGVGGLTGALVGNSVDERQARRHEQVAVQAQAAANQRALQLPDIVNLTASGASDQIIINQIRSTGTVYNLSANDIMYLRSSRVSDPVIAEMQSTAYRPQRVYTTSPPPVVVYDPPPAVGVGVVYHSR
jgi:hypothetical protein